MTKQATQAGLLTLSGFAVVTLCVGVFAAPLSSFAQEDSGPADIEAVASEDPASVLQQRRDSVRAELDSLSQNIGLSSEKAKALEESIAALEKTASSLRQALIDSADRRKQLENQVLESEKNLAELRGREADIRVSFQERRGVLAEVLAALQRMGRNPPPALLVTPDDALASVRSAILLGAVVPGIRGETDRLMADLDELAKLQASIVAERNTLTATMTASLEEEERMNLLLIENDKLGRQSLADLEAERKRSEELASKATSLESLIVSLESEISSVRRAVEEAKAEEDRKSRQSEEEKAKARALAESGVPDKNRIAPAYPFSSLRAKLEFPAAGDILRQFGDADGTGHSAKGMTIASNPGAVVTAPADGLVVFAGAFRSYGQMVILNAGDGYHLVLTGMDQIKTRQGKFVFSGEPIAVMGEKRVASATALALETDRPTLYIEFRKDGAPVDSRPWWNRRETGKARNDS